MKISDEDQTIVSGINVTPLVDITLVLLIIFMVTATFVSEQALSVALPKVQTRENAPSPAISVTLAKTGQIKLMKKDVSLQELGDKIKQEAQLDPAVKILVKADKDTSYEKVAEVLDAIKLAGVVKVALAVERK
jgi:biopolymer transport protein ExbD